MDPILRPSRPWWPAGLALILFVALLAPGPAFAGKKALVIGVNDYDSWTDLANAGNDARDVSAELRKLGFDVTSLQDPTHDKLKTTLNTWADSLGKSDTALFYFAGHGFQIRRDEARGDAALEGNYLVPKDMPTPTSIHITAAGKHALPLEDARRRLRYNEPRALIFILDACRNNPWAAERALKRGGLASVTPASGELFLYATSAGRTSSDNPAGKNGLFTQALLRELKKADQDVEDMAKRVGHAVATVSKGGQVPFRASSLTGEIWLGAPSAGGSTRVASASQPASSGGGRGGGAVASSPACPFPGILFGGDPEEPDVMACLFPVDGSPPGGYGRCDLGAGQIGYGWPAGVDDSWECEPGFVRQDTDRGRFCSVAVGPPPGAAESCAADFASDELVGFVWSASANPPDVARSAAAAGACPGPWAIVDGLISCSLEDVGVPEYTEIVCTDDHAGFALPSDYEQPGPGDCPDGFRPASWAVGCEVAWARPPAGYGCNYDEFEETFSLYWTP